MITNCGILDLCTFPFIPWKYFLILSLVCFLVSSIDCRTRREDEIRDPYPECVVLEDSPSLPTDICLPIMEIHYNVFRGVYLSTGCGGGFRP